VRDGWSDESRCSVRWDSSRLLKKFAQNCRMSVGWALRISRLRWLTSLVYVDGSDIRVKEG